MPTPAMRTGASGHAARSRAASVSVGMRISVRILLGGLATDDGFQLIDRDGDALVASDHAAARFGDDDVVLDADAAEIAVSLFPDWQ